jgi:hypothetical protein
MKSLFVIAALVAAILCFSPAYSQNTVGFNIGIGLDLPVGTFTPSQPKGRMLTFTGQFDFPVSENASWVTDISYHALNYDTDNSLTMICVALGPKFDQPLASNARAYLAVPMIGLLTVEGYRSATIGFGAGLIIPYRDSTRGVDIGIRITHAGPFFSGPLSYINILNLQCGVTIF